MASQRGENIEVMNHLQDAIGLGETLHQPIQLVPAYIMSVYLQSRLGEIDKCRTLLSKARQIADFHEYESWVTKTLAMEGFLLKKEERYEEGAQVYEEALRLMDNEDTGSKLNFIINLGSIYNHMGQYDSTQVLIEKHSQLISESGPYWNAFSQSLLVPNLIENNQLNQAEKILNTWFGIMQSDDAFNVNVYYGDMSKIAIKRGHFELALNYYKKADSIEAELESRDVIRKLTEANLNYEFEKEKLVMNMETEKEKSILIAERNRFQLFGFGGSFIALLIGGLYLFIRRANKKIFSQNIELEKLNSTKDQLFQIIGHDLRKPVLAFRNVSKNLNYLINKGEIETLIKLGASIEAEGQALYKLTDNLLHWALTQKDLLTINPKSINAHQLVQENIRLFLANASNKNVEILNEVDQEHAAIVDENSMHVIVRNLLDNAIKFSNAGGRVLITSRKTNDTLSVIFADTGLGMRSEKIEKLLKGDGLQSTIGTNHEKGTGLGLKIVQSMIKKNNGELLIDGAEGVGTSFSVVLPIAS